MAARVRRADFLDAEDYARAMHEAGGPMPGERYSFHGSAGPYSAMMAAVYGANPAEAAEIARKHEADEQARRPHVFVRKLRGGRRKGPK